jgi:hypothetical protein
MMAAYQTHPYADMTLYLRTFNEIKNLDFFTFIEYLGVNFVITSKYELFVEVNAFVISSFTDNARYTFVLTILVFFIFWKEILNSLIKEYDFFQRKNLVAVYFLLCFGIYVIFYRVINGRFYLAYWIFILAFHKIFVEKKWKYFFILLLSILVHQSYLFLFLLSLLYFLINKNIQNKKTEYFLFFLIIIGTIYSNLGISYLNKYLMIFTGGSEIEYSNYLKESYVIGEQERDRKWFLVFRTPLLFYALTLHVLYLRLIKKFNFEKDLVLYYFILIFWAINAFTIEVPSFGPRFRNVLIGLLLLLLFKLYNRNYQSRPSIPVVLTLSFFLFYKIVSLKILELYINKFTFFPFSIVWQAFFGEAI